MEGGNLPSPAGRSRTSDGLDRITSRQIGKEQARSEAITWKTVPRKRVPGRPTGRADHIVVPPVSDWPVGMPCLPPESSGKSHVRSQRRIWTTAAVATAAVTGVLVFQGVTGSSTPDGAADAKSAPAKADVHQTPLKTSADGATASLPQRSTERFSLLGVTWTDPAAKVTGQVEARTRSAATGEWTGWLPLDTEIDGRTETGRAGVRGTTEPRWVGPSNGVEVRISAADGVKAGLPEGLRLDTVDPGGTTTPPAAAEPAAFAAEPAAFAAEETPSEEPTPSAEPSSEEPPADPSPEPPARRRPPRPRRRPPRAPPRPGPRPRVRPPPPRRPRRASHRSRRPPSPRPRRCRPHRRPRHRSRRSSRGSPGRPTSRSTVRHRTT